MGTKLPSDKKERLINILRDNADVFAWSYNDMSGIDPSITVDRLDVDPKA